MGECAWNINDYREKLCPKHRERLSDHFRASSRAEIQDADVTDELLYESYIFMAGIVRTYGEQFLPIFERLHSEIEMREERRSLLETATEVSKANDLV